MTDTIRKATLDDVPAIAKVILSLFEHHFEGFSFDDSAQRIGRHLNQCLADDSHSVYVAADESGQIAGYVAVHWLPYLFLPGPEGFVSELFIAEDARAQGIGSKLLLAVVQEAESRGCSRLSLINMRGRESYERGFYAKHGWEERPDAANFILRLK